MTDEDHIRAARKNHGVPTEEPSIQGELEWLRDEVKRLRWRVYVLEMMVEEES